MCKKCILDTDTDPDLHIEADGVCNRCHSWEAAWSEKKKLEDQFPSIIARIKNRGRAIIGLSGGADSAWTYWIARLNDLDVTPIHFDNGYDLPVATENLRLITEHWGDELQTLPVDGTLFRRVQRAFLATMPNNLEIPTDHAIKAVTYKEADKRNIYTILNGTNMATESHGSPAWTQGHADWRYIKSVAESQGVSIDAYPHYTLLDRETWMRGIWWLSLLEYTDYHRQRAIDEMHRKCGYIDYGFKHMESRITRFLHGYIIPRRYGWDTRRSRLSAMICSGQLTRGDALRMIAHPAYPPAEMEDDKLMFCSRLGITVEQFEAYMTAPLRRYSDFQSYINDPLIRVARKAMRVIRHD